MEQLSPLQIEALNNDLGALTQSMKDLKEYQDTFQQFFQSNRHIFEKLTTLLDNQASVSATMYLYQNQINKHPALQSFLETIEKYSTKFDFIQDNLATAAEKFSNEATDYFQERENALSEYFKKKHTQFEVFGSQQQEAFEKMIEESKRIIDAQNLTVPLNNLSFLPSIDELLKKTVAHIEIHGKQQQEDAIKVMLKLGESIDNLCRLMENQPIKNQAIPTLSTEVNHTSKPKEDAIKEEIVNKTYLKEETETPTATKLWALCTKADVLTVVEPNDYIGNLLLIEIDIDTTNLKKASFHLGYPIINHEAGIQNLEADIKNFAFIAKNFVPRADQEQNKLYRCPDCMRRYTQSEWKNAKGMCKNNTHARKLLEPLLANADTINYGKAEWLNNTTWRITKKTDIGIY